MSELLRDGRTHFRHGGGLERFTHKEFLERVVVLRVALATPHNDVAVRVFAETAGSVRRSAPPCRRSSQRSLRTSSTAGGEIGRRGRCHGRLKPLLARSTASSTRRWSIWRTNPLSRNTSKLRRFRRATERRRVSGHYEIDYRRLRYCVANSTSQIKRVKTKSAQKQRVICDALSGTLYPGRFV